MKNIIPKNNKIDWSGRGHDYTTEEIAEVTHVMKNSNPLTQGSYQDEFEKNSGYIPELSLHLQFPVVQLLLNYQQYLVD